jgi:hypothetical protein
MVGKITGKYAQSLVQFVNKNYKSDLVESVNESTPDQVIKDLDKAKNDLLKKVDALIAKKKKLYSDVDIEAPMSADEKKLDKDIADLFSQINKLVLQKRSVKKESVNEASLSDIDIIAQEAKDFKDFVIQFYKEYKDFPKTKESMKWLAGVYKNRSKMEGLK